MKTEDKIGMWILILSAITGTIFPSAARWILIVLVGIGLLNYWRES